MLDGDGDGNTGDNPPVRDDLFSSFFVLFLFAAQLAVVSRCRCPALRSEGASQIHPLQDKQHVLPPSLRALT